MNSKINTCGLVSRSAGRPTEIEDITTISLNRLSGWTSTGEVYNDYLPSYFYIINAHWRETRTQTFSLTFMTDEKSPIDGSAWSINRLAHVLGFMSVCILQRYFSDRTEALCFIRNEEDDEGKSHYEKSVRPAMKYRCYLLSVRLSLLCREQEIHFGVCFVIIIKYLMYDLFCSRGTNTWICCLITLNSSSQKQKNKNTISLLVVCKKIKQNHQ